MWEDAGSMKPARSPLFLSLLLALGACAGSPSRVAPFSGDPDNATYSLENQPVALRQGAGRPASGRDVEVTLTGARLDADLNEDGRTDRVVVLGRDDGDATSLYLTALVSDGDAYEAAGAARLGDRLVVKSLVAEGGGEVRVRLLVPDPKAKDKTRPSKPVERRFALRGGAFVPLDP